jgi:hypothetical protein
MSEDDTREQGVEFGEFEETMETLDYPIDNDELLDQHGNAELELPEGTTTLSAVLEPIQDDEQTYENEDDLETMIMNMVGDDAVGREGYSDRGDEPQEGDDNQESF